jgi:hypothetical protein
MKKFKLSAKQVKALKSYLRAVLVSGLTLLASTEFGLDPAVAVVLAAIAGPGAKALDKSETEYGLGAKE